MDRGLDLAGGGGILAGLAAEHARHVVATDINPRAVAFCRFNADLNGLTHRECRQGEFAGSHGVSPEPFLRGLPAALRRLVALGIPTVGGPPGLAWPVGETRFTETLMTRPGRAEQRAETLRRDRLGVNPAYCHAFPRAPSTGPGSPRSPA